MTFQLQDDHSRLAIATLVASGETSEAAIAVVKKGIKDHGAPQRLLTDNGAALNPSRRGVEGQPVAYVTSLGVKAITGKPYKPTDPGEERTLPPDPVSLAGQAATGPTPRGTPSPSGRVRPHLQHRASAPGTARAHHSPAVVGCNSRCRGTQAKPDPFRGQSTREAAVFDTGTAKEDIQATVGLERVTGSIIHPSGAGSRKLKAYSNGVVNIGRTIFSLTASMSGRTVIASWDDDGVIFANTDGEVVADYAWPLKGTAYVGISRSRPFFGKDQNPGQLSPTS